MKKYAKHVEFDDKFVLFNAFVSFHASYIMFCEFPLNKHGATVFIASQVTRFIGWIQMRI